MGMRSFSKEQIKKLDEQAKEIFREVTEGKSLSDILAQIYVDNLDDKTQHQGAVMAEAILTSIQNFDSDFESAKANLSRYVEQFINKVCENKTPVERCNYLLKLSTAVGSAQSVMVAQIEEQKKEIEELMARVEEATVLEEEATEALEAELREKVIEALLGSSVMLSALMQQKEQLEEMKNAEETARLLIDMGSEEVDYRAITAMLAYVNIKNGTFEDMPPEMTADQVATLVCAHSEQTHILQAVESGNMAVDIATTVLRVLGIVVIARMCLGATLIGIAVCVSAFGWILTIPAFLVLLTALAYSLEKAVTVWNKGAHHIIHIVTTGVDLWISAATRILAFGKEKVLPMISEAAKKLLSGIKKIWAELRGGESTREEEMNEVLQAEEERPKILE